MLQEAMTALSESLTSIAGLRCYDHVPEQINPPAAIVSLGAGTYDEDFDGAVEFEATILLLVSEGQGAKRAQAAFQEYLDPSGITSVAAAVHAVPTLSGVVDFARVVGWADPQSFDVGGINYVGVEVTVDLIASS